MKEREITEADCCDGAASERASALAETEWRAPSSLQDFSLAYAGLLSTSVHVQHFSPCSTSPNALAETERRASDFSPQDLSPAYPSPAASLCGGAHTGPRPPSSSERASETRREHWARGATVCDSDTRTERGKGGEGDTACDSDRRRERGRG